MGRVRSISKRNSPLMKEVTTRVGNKANDFARHVVRFTLDDSSLTYHEHSFLLNNKLQYNVV